MEASEIHSLFDNAKRDCSFLADTPNHTKCHCSADSFTVGYEVYIAVLLRILGRDTVLPG